MAADAHDARGSSAAWKRLSADAHDARRSSRLGKGLAADAHMMLVGLRRLGKGLAADAHDARGFWTAWANPEPFSRTLRSLPSAHP